jgi:hypothetical protein
MWLFGLGIRRYKMEWGTWECPECHKEHSDPETATITSCGGCGTPILLSAIDRNNIMVASKIDLSDYSLESISAAKPVFK